MSKDLIHPVDEGKCVFCDTDAVYAIDKTRLCILHFSVIRNEMAGLVLKEHAFVQRSRPNV